MNLPLFWLLMTFFWTSLMSFFSAEEMACISYNKLKLEVQARVGSRRAEWIRTLLQNPSSFFGTTLIGVNLCLVISSECMRQFFTSLGWNPNLSPIVHVPYILLFGELIPMFVARLFPEHTARFGSPILKITSLFITPLAYVSESMFRFTLRPLLKSRETHVSSLFHREELQELLRTSHHQKKENFSASLLFQSLQKLKEKRTEVYMMPIDSLPKIYEKRNPSLALARMRSMKKEIAAVYNNQKKIIGYVTEDDIILAPLSRPLKAIAHSTIFVSEIARASDTLARMEQERESYAFVINNKGDITGIVSLHSLLEEFIPQLISAPKNQPLHISKTVSAGMKVSDFCTKYDIDLPHSPEDTFLDLMENALDHKPKVGEKFFLGSLEITVKETTLLGPKTLFVQS